jgi:hypothetical protein
MILLSGHRTDLSSHRVEWEQKKKIEQEKKKKKENILIPYSIERERENIISNG